MKKEVEGEKKRADDMEKEKKKLQDEKKKLEKDLLDKEKIAAKDSEVGDTIKRHDRLYHPRRVSVTHEEDLKVFRERIETLKKDLMEEKSKHDEMRKQMKEDQEKRKKSAENAAACTESFGQLRKAQE